MVRGVCFLSHGHPCSPRKDSIRVTSAFTESVADFIQGRTNRSVSANHYLAKNQQANFWYGKIITKINQIVHI